MEPRIHAGTFGSRILTRKLRGGDAATIIPSVRTSLSEIRDMRRHVREIRSRKLGASRTRFRHGSGASDRPASPPTRAQLSMWSPSSAAVKAKLCVADPALLALPALAAGERIRPTGPRSCEPLTASLLSMGPAVNLFGVHDIYGRGTHVPASPHADPFVMCTVVKAPAGFKPPFCAHPHCGASVASILFQGTAIRPWDNVSGTEAKPLLPGGIYHVDTGAGCVHDEPMEPVDLRRCTRPGFAEGEPTSVPPDAEGRTWMMQLWWNGIDMQQPPGAPLRPVSTQAISPDAHATRHMRRAMQCAMQRAMQRAIRCAMQCAMCTTQRTLECIAAMRHVMRLAMRRARWSHPTPCRAS